MQSHENYVITCMLNRYECCNEAIDKLHESDFEDPVAQLIFKSIKFIGIETGSEICDSDLVFSWISRNCPGVYPQIAEVLIGIDSSFSGTSTFDSNVYLIKKLAHLRTIKAKCTTACVKCDKVESPKKIVSELFEGLSMEDSESKPKNIAEVFKEFEKDNATSYFDFIQTRQESYKQHGYSIKGFPTGLVDLDKKIHGLQRSHFIVIGARPGVGKTAFMLNMALNMSKQGRKVLIFSLEMPALELVERMLCLEAGVSQEELHTGKLDGEGFRALLEAHNKIKGLDIVIDDYASLSLLQITQRIKRHSINGIDVCLIDYLQLIRSGSSNFESRQIEIANISRSLKAIAKKMKIPVVALAQLNRQSDMRVSKIPLLSDLRESGSIEADADAVILLHMPDLYDPNNKPQILEAYIAKNRHGETGKIEFFFRKTIGSINNFDRKKIIKEAQNEFAEFA